jgi:hypothetical protein
MNERLQITKKIPVLTISQRQNTIVCETLCAGISSLKMSLLYVVQQKQVYEMHIWYGPVRALEYGTGTH